MMGWSVAAIRSAIAESGSGSSHFSATLASTTIVTGCHGLPGPTPRPKAPLAAARGHSANSSHLLKSLGARWFRGFGENVPELLFQRLSFGERSRPQSFHDPLIDVANEDLRHPAAP